MMEEFRRRKNLKRYYELMKKRKQDEAELEGEKPAIIDMSDAQMTTEQVYDEAGPERFFTPGEDDTFDPNEFTLIFIDSDSVTNVTSLNRINHRRVLMFIGNSQGVLSYGKGKGDDYENAFEDAFKQLRKNLICIPLD